MSFYSRVGGACFLYTHCQALPAPPFRFRWCAASVFAGPLSSGQVPIRRGASGKVLFRHAAGRHPAVVSKHTPPRNYPHSYARFRVTLREKVDLAMPDAVLDMRFAHYLKDFADDEGFLQATHQAG